MTAIVCLPLRINPEAQTLARGAGLGLRKDLMQAWAARSLQ